MDIDPTLRKRFEEGVIDNRRTPRFEEFGNLLEARDFVNWCLEGSYTDEGIKIWWNRPRTQLSGMTPTEAWQSCPETVFELAIWLLY